MLLAHFLAPDRLREIGRTKETYDRLHGAGLLGIAAVAFQSIILAGDAEQTGQVCAGREAEYANPVGIDVVLLGTGPQPADGGLAILDLGRKAIARRQA